MPKPPSPLSDFTQNNNNNRSATDSWNVYTRFDKNQFRIIGVWGWRVRACVRVRHTPNHKMGKYVCLHSYELMASSTHRQTSQHQQLTTGDTRIYVSKHVAFYENDNNINKHNLMRTPSMDGDDCCCHRRCRIVQGKHGNRFVNGERDMTQCSGHAPNISAYLIFKYGWLIDDDDGVRRRSAMVVAPPQHYHSSIKTILFMVKNDDDYCCGNRLFTRALRIFL